MRLRQSRHRLPEARNDRRTRRGVRDKRIGVEEWLPLEKASELMGLAAEDIEWAFEEFGECESEDHIALDQEW